MPAIRVRHRLRVKQNGFWLDHLTTFTPFAATMMARIHTAESYSDSMGTYMGRLSREGSHLTAPMALVSTALVAALARFMRLAKGLRRLFTSFMGVTALVRLIV